MISTRIAAGLFALSLVFVGCSDLPTAEPSAGLDGESYSKFHHAHLLDRTTTGVAGKGQPMQDNVNLIVGFSSPTVDAMRVVTRWRIVSRWRVVTRWTYRSSFNGISISIPRADLPAFLADAEINQDVAWVQPDLTLRLPSEATGTIVESGQTTPWGIADVGADRSSAVSGDGVEDPADLPNIFLLDTGAASQDLNVVACMEVVDGSVSGCRNNMDRNGHGTEVIGFAAARDNDHGIVGVAPGAPVYVVKVLNEQGEGEESDVIAAIDYLTAYKLANPDFPMLVNMSLGADAETTEYIALDFAVERAIDAGITVVVAAGNDSRDASTYSPAHVAGAITVGAYDKSGHLSRFSNGGTTVDLLAPGEKVEALTTGDYKVVASGTSHATAWVTGAAALYLARNPQASPSDVKAALISGASPLKGGRAGTTDLGLNVSGF
ncbi:MAG: S8 family serine peptidase [Rhodothermales bacterium]